MENKEFRNIDKLIITVNRSKHIKPLASLPNWLNFEFIAVYRDGTERVQKVHKDSKGLHFIDNFNLIEGWKYLQKI